MRRFLFFCLVVSGLVLVSGAERLSRPVAAQVAPSVQIRALLPQPSTGQPEWILLERGEQSAATFSATLRDTHGSTKSYSWVWASDRSWYQVTATQSGLALNNDQDSVVLEVNGSVVDASDTYSSAEREQVWTKLSAGWQWLTLAEFEERRETANWRLEPAASASPTPHASPRSSPGASVVPVTVPASGSSFPVASSAGKISPTQAASPTPYPGKALRLEVLSSPEPASRLELPTLPAFQEPDYSAEQARYQAWLQWWRRALGLFLGSAVCWWSVVVLQVLKKISQRSARRWGWSLLS